jgi:sugar lactone lactonase YvrE
MPNTVTSRVAVALFSLFIAGSLQAQAAAPAAEPSPLPSIESLEQQSAEAFAAGDPQRAYDINLQLHQLRPYMVDYMVGAIRAAALQDRKTEAYEMMLKMQRQGLSYDFNQTDDTLRIRKTEIYMYVNDLMVEAGKPAGEGQVAFTLPGAPADFQAIAWDSSRSKFLVGTAARGTVLAVAEDGSTEVLLKAADNKGMWSVNGLAADPARNRLWVSTAATPKFEGFVPAEKNQGALLEFNLETLEPVNQYFLPIDKLPHELGSLALTDDGHVYVIDRALPVVYRKTPDGDRLEAFVGSRELVSFSDLAVAPDNSRLFVADRVRGVFVVDPVAEQATMLGGPDNLNLGGIEGIEYAAGKLFIVQGGLQPQRLMRLELEASGSAVESVAPMAVALPGFDRPGIGAVLGEALYYFANPGAAEGAQAVQVMRTPLESGQAIVPPDLRKFQQSIKNRQQQG